MDIKHFQQRLGIYFLKYFSRRLPNCPDTGCPSCASLMPPRLFSLQPHVRPQAARLKAQERSQSKWGLERAGGAIRGGGGTACVSNLSHTSVSTVTVVSVL